MTVNLKLPQLVGLGIVAIGVVLMLLAWRGSSAPVDQISDALTGHYTDRTMLYLILGIVALIAGSVLAMSGRRKT